MRAAMIRLDPTTGTFTSTHLQFIRLCMETRSYKAALPILDNYIHSLPLAVPQATRDNLEYSVIAADSVASGEYIHARSGHTDKITLANLHEYYVLGAMAYLGEREYKKALQFLEHVLITPAHNALTGLMLEAYKKWVLLTCLVDKASYKNAPRTMSSSALKNCKAAASAYEALADAFQQLNNLPQLKAQVNAGRDIWGEVSHFTNNITMYVALTQRRTATKVWWKSLWNSRTALTFPGYRGHSPPYPCRTLPVTLVVPWSKSRPLRKH